VSAAVHIRMPHLRVFASVRRTVPSLALQSTATGWGLYDDTRRPVFEAEGRQARLACLRRAAALGVVWIRAGEEPHVLGATSAPRQATAPW
jgi:hypothetical protein